MVSCMDVLKWKHAHGKVTCVVMHLEQWLLFAQLLAVAGNVFTPFSMCNNE